jgi:hypothetical protein
MALREKKNSSISLAATEREDKTKINTFAHQRFQASNHFKDDERSISLARQYTKGKKYWLC